MYYKITPMKNKNLLLKSKSRLKYFKKNENYYNILKEKNWPSVKTTQPSVHLMRKERMVSTILKEGT